MKNSSENGEASVELISIGELASKTGLSPERLRSWEQRYGKPEPVRLESGHRRYPVSEVNFLMDVGRLLVQGFKASDLLKERPEDLRERVERASHQPFEELEYWRSLVERFDAKALKGAMHKMAEETTLVDFLDKRIAPFLWDLGERWASGELRVSHEHFATFRVSEVLGELAPDLEPTKQGVKVLLATLPGDLHGLGVVMAEAILSESGVEVIVLGADNPVREIAATAKSAGATHIALSVSRGLAQRGVGKLVEELIEAAPDHELVLGGGGVSMGIRLPKKVRQFRSMSEFQRWLKRMK